jgi:hypothetical protein
MADKLKKNLLNYLKLDTKVQLRFHVGIQLTCFAISNRLRVVRDQILEFGFEFHRFVAKDFRRLELMCPKIAEDFQLIHGTI